MGNETFCRVRCGAEASRGKALLETSEILFRGKFRLKIPFSTIASAKAVDGELRLQTSEHTAIFALGATAEKWLEKILHPKSRMEKLNVKPGAKISLIGKFEQGFLREILALTKSVTRGQAGADADQVFFAAESKEDFSHLYKIAKSLSGAAALWIVYPKGQKDLRENDVLAAGRNSGLKDVKVVGFSLTHTALKFVIPRERR